MKSIISKILLTGTIVAALTFNLQAQPTRAMMSDTGKMSKMKKMDKKKMNKKMPAKKMMKDTGKMSKM